MSQFLPISTYSKFIQGWQAECTIECKKRRLFASYVDSKIFLYTISEIFPDIIAPDGTIISVKRVIDHDVWSYYISLLCDWVEEITGIDTDLLYKRGVSTNLTIVPFLLYFF